MKAFFSQTWVVAVMVGIVIVLLAVPAYNAYAAGKENEGKDDKSGK